MMAQKQRSVLCLLFLVFLTNCHFAQTPKSPKLEYPNSKIGGFAKAWFKAVDANSLDDLQPYNITKEGWDDYFKTILALAKDVGGITPVMLSYSTKEAISIYAKEGRGKWVLVNLGLTDQNEILEMSIKKSYEPEDYALRFGMNSRQVRQVVEAIANEFEQNYVVKEKGVELRNYLLENLKERKYSGIQQGDLLANILTKALRKFANDKHLQVIPPGRLSEVRARFGPNDLAEIKTGNGNDVLHESGDSSLELEETLPITGEMLENNVGYIKIERFVDAPKVNAETERIMQMLSDTKAMIIDLTQSGGGDGVATNHLLGYFFESATSINAQSDQIKPNALSKAYAKKPLYVLISRRSISAAEGFAYFLKQKQRATLIGETTAGAGYRVDAYQLPFDFYLVNSIGTGFKAGEGWQGKGVVPDIKSGASEAKKVAMDRIK